MSGLHGHLGVDVVLTCSVLLESRKGLENVHHPIRNLKQLDVWEGEWKLRFVAMGVRVSLIFVCLIINQDLLKNPIVK